MALTNTLNVTRLRCHGSRFPPEPEPEAAAEPEPEAAAEAEAAAATPTPTGAVSLEQEQRLETRRARVAIERRPSAGAAGERWALRIGLSRRGGRAGKGAAGCVSEGGDDVAADSAEDKPLFSKVALSASLPHD